MHMFLSADEGLTSQKDEVVDFQLSPQIPIFTDTLGMFEVVASQLILSFAYMEAGFSVIGTV